MKIQAAVIHEAGQPFRIEEVELAPPKAGELLVKIVACGVCHTDDVARQQFIPVPLPAVFGHEGSGIVEQVGEGVTEFKVGDRVGFSYAYCKQCENCLGAHQFACENFNDINFGGVMPDGTKRLSQDGVEISTFFGQSTFATYAVVHESNTVKVDDPDIDLALVAPLGCGIQTGAGAVLNRLRPKFGTSIAVFGCGTVGMSAIMAAKIAGCEKIIAVGGNAKSLELALELGATHTINRKECGDDNIVKEVKKICPRGVHYSVDTTGYAPSVRRALACVKFFGTCCVLGATGDISFNVQNELMGDAKSLVGCTEGDAVSKLFIPKLIEYYKQGRFPFDKLMKFYSFEDINQAFEDSGSGKVIKAVLRM